MYDIMIIGQITLDHNIDYDGREEYINGGAVTFAGYAAAAIGYSVAVVPKGNSSVINPYKVFSDSKVKKIYPIESLFCTEMQNTYFTPDQEQRHSLNIHMIDPYKPSDLPNDEARIYHIGGLVAGDISNDFILACAKRGDTALDIQSMLRCRGKEGLLKLCDWPEKQQYLPMIRYLKTDAAEAFVLTGTEDREKAAFVLCEWGAKEVIVTHKTEIIVCDGNNIFRSPLLPHSLMGRTGRGDTTFACYITERLNQNISDALEFTAALVSLKMETPGPFKGTRQDVYDFMKKYYQTNRTDS